MNMDNRILPFTIAATVLNYVASISEKSDPSMRPKNICDNMIIQWKHYDEYISEYVKELLVIMEYDNLYFAKFLMNQFLGKDEIYCLILIETKSHRNQNSYDFVLLDI